MPERDNKEKIRALIDNNDVSITANIEEEYIITTEDKIRILYDEYNEVVRKSENTLAFLGIMITLIISDFTCEFKNVLCLDSSTIRAVFIVATFLFVFLTGKSAFIWWKNRNKMSFEFFIVQLKGKELENLRNNKEL